MTVAKLMRLASVYVVLAISSGCGNSFAPTLPQPGNAVGSPGNGFEALGAPSPMEPASTIRSGQATIIDEQRINDRLIELTIATTAFPEPTKVNVNLPAGYDTTRRWPVTFYLAGTNHTYSDFNQQYGGAQLVEEFSSIVVSPTGKSGYWSDWYNRGAFGPPLYETYVIDQLIPLIDQRFSTIGRRAGRAVIGESMGGYGAMMLAARHPDLFVAVASVSGTVDTNLGVNAAALSGSSAIDGAEPDAIYGARATEEVRWRGHNPYDLADNLRALNLWVGSANGTMIDTAIGESAADIPGCALEINVYNASVSFHQRLGELGIPHVWMDLGAGCHSVPNFQRQIREALKIFTAAFDARLAVPTKFDYRSIESKFEIWNWSVEADPSRAIEFLEMENVSASGLTLSGSGLTSITTPAFYPGVRQVRIKGGDPAVVSPDELGRLRFKVDLGTANMQQQFSPGADTQVRTVVLRLLPQV